MGMTGSTSLPEVDMMSHQEKAQRKTEINATKNLAKQQKDDHSWKLDEIRAKQLDTRLPEQEIESTNESSSTLLDYPTKA